jgi:competence protein ComGC
MESFWDSQSPAHSGSRSCSAFESAFTRAELLILLGVLTLLALVVLPALANTRPRSSRVICANNLRQIGMAMQLWGNEHNDQPPWDVTVPQGGTKAHPLAVNVWLHFAWMSNELASAKVLFCPSDTGRPASDFGFSPETGYLHANMRGNATSYLLAHAFGTAPNSLLIADRNVGWDRTTAGCPWFNTALGAQVNPFVREFVWNTNLHNQQGNLLTADGRVEQTSNQGLRDFIANYRFADNADMHFITPR